MPTEVYFHEDDFGQIEIIPFENMGHCLEQIGEIDEHSQQHMVAPGVWDELHIRTENPRTLAEKAITESELLIHFGDFENTENVYTGYSSHREKLESSSAIILAEYCTLIVQLGENGLVSGLFLVDYGGLGDVPDSGLALAKVMSKYDLILVDWCAGIIVGQPTAENMMGYIENATNDG